MCWRVGRGFFRNRENDFLQYLFIYLQLHRVFIVVYGLSLVVAIRGHSLIAVRFSCCPGSRTQAQHLWDTGVAAPRTWNLPKLGIEPMSPALAGGFLTTGLPRKSEKMILSPTHHPRLCKQIPNQCEKNSRVKVLIHTAVTKTFSQERF